jgi:hypothetical protein
MTTWSTHRASAQVPMAPARPLSKPILRAHMTVLARRRFVSRSPLEQRDALAAHLLQKRRSPESH